MVNFNEIKITSQAFLCNTYMYGCTFVSVFVSQLVWDRDCHFSSVYARLTGQGPSRDCSVFTSCVLGLQMLGLQLSFTQVQGFKLGSWQSAGSTLFTEPFPQSTSWIFNGFWEFHGKYSGVPYFTASKSAISFRNKGFKRILKGYCKKTTKMMDACGHLCHLEHLSLGYFCNLIMEIS